MRKSLLIVGLLALFIPSQVDAALVGHWSFDDASSTTNLLGDSSTSGANNSGTFASGTTPAGAAGVVGGAMELFGNQNINVGSSSDFDTTSWTTTMWAKTDTLAGWRTALGSWGGGPPNSIHFGLNGNDRWGDHGGGETSSNASATMGEWTHLVSRRSPNGQENSIWVNGVKQTQTTTGVPATPGGANVYIGTKNGGENHWDGMLDDLGYFGETLSDGKARGLYTLALPASMGSAFDFNYDAGEAAELFAAFDAEDSASVGDDNWEFADNLNGIAGGATLGDLFTSGDQTYLLLDNSRNGSGLVLALEPTQVPEPTTMVIWLLVGAIGLASCRRRRSTKA